MNDQAPSVPEELPSVRLLTLEPKFLCLNTAHICELLDVQRGTWTGWVTRGMAPPKDFQVGGSPVWYLKTIIEYTRNAPGGRLGYPVG